MKDYRHLLHEIDRYLNGEMDVAEKAAFEQLCQASPDVEQRVKEQSEFRGMLTSYAERKALKEKLRTVEQKVTTPSSTPGQVVQMPSFRKRIVQTIAVAATVALLVASGFLWSAHNYNSNKNDNTYMILRREIDNIRRSQDALLHNITAPQTPANPGSYGGTGFAISSNGYIATNAHVIENADSIYIQNSKGENYKTKVIFKDSQSDLAVLKVEDSSFLLPALPYTVRSHPADIGEDVYTLGYPKDDIVYGKGYISGETGFLGDTSAYQVTLSVNPGNSGGPLLDTHGNVTGIVSGKQTSSSDIAFAIKSNYLKNMMDSLSGNPDFNKKCSILNKSSNSLRLSRVDQIKKVESFIFMVKVYN